MIAVLLKLGVPQDICYASVSFSYSRTVFSLNQIRMDKALVQWHVCKPVMYVYVCIKYVKDNINFCCSSLHNDVPQMTQRNVSIVAHPALWFVLKKL